jgi:phosphoglucan,water dikinase
MSDLKLKFQLICKNTVFGENVSLVGNQTQLGNWDTNKSIELKTDKHIFPLWESNLISFNNNSNLEYKYIISNKNSHSVKWESFQGNRQLNLSNLNKDGEYIINDGEFSSNINPKITKINSNNTKITEKKNKNKNNNNKKEPYKTNINNNSQNQNMSNIDEYVQSRRDEIKNIEIKNDYNTQNISNKKISLEIQNFINILIQKNSQENTWREKLSFTCELINANDSNDQIISLIATYLYFVNSGQIKCSEDGTHFRPNHSAKHAFNIFKKLYKKIFFNSEQINENSFSIVARSILRNLPSFDEQFMVQVPLTRIRDIAHRSDIPHDLKQEIKHKLQNKLHRNASPDDLIVCEYFINKIKDSNYSEEFKNQFFIFYDELKEFFNSSGLEKILTKFKDISQENSNKTENIINIIKSNDLIKKIELITDFRKSVCYKIIKDEVLNQEENIQKTLLQTTSNLDIELENKLFVIISEYINKLTQNINQNKFEINYFKKLLHLYNLCLININTSQIAEKQVENLSLDFDYFIKNIENNNLNRFIMLQIKSIIERGNNISIEICSNLEHLFNLDNLLFLGNKLSINQRAILVFVESFIRSNIIFQFSKCCDLLMTIIRDYLQLPPFNIINKGIAQGEFFYFENIEQYNKENIKDNNDKILFIEKSDGTEEIPKNVIGIVLNQDLSQLSHISIRVRQHGAVFCCVLDTKVFKNFISQFKNKDLISFECLDESKINIKKIESLQKINNDNKKIKNNENISLKENKFVDKKNDKIEENDIETLIYSVKDKKIPNTGSKFEKIKKLYEISENSNLFSVPYALCIPNTIYKYFFNLFIQENSQYLSKLESTEIKDLDIESEIFRNHFINYIMKLYEQKNEKIKFILEKINSEFTSLKSNNNLLAIRSSSNLEDNSGQAGAGLFDSYLNIDLSNEKDIINHISKVWASLFNSRAIINRKKLNIETKEAKMSVIIMQMTEPVFSYVIHTINPVNKNENEIYIELAIGLGETLAQSNQKGAPYRLIYNRKEDKLNILNLSSYNYELEKKTNKVKIIEYRKQDLTINEDFINKVGKTLGKIGITIEENVSNNNCRIYQDIEGNYVKIGNQLNYYFIVQTRPEIA